jgi:hypothetical protein
MSAGRSQTDLPHHPGAARPLRRPHTDLALHLGSVVEDEHPSAAAAARALRAAWVEKLASRLIRSSRPRPTKDHDLIVSHHLIRPPTSCPTCTSRSAIGGSCLGPDLTDQQVTGCVHSFGHPHVSVQSEMRMRRPTIAPSGRPAPPQRAAGPRSAFDPMWPSGTSPDAGDVPGHR